ncbi:MAG: PhnD/SsuA/transferrin family substrate-binding protein [Zoogloea oleivorans]|jgi:phosphonate transport system substrate-binding protein|uniref:PhnD/SsuA/transferrin family substrate-binding protein n=1 Tax=Zoogloea oleivorans TaxID=1552750 RepID=UPI002A35AD42|nr:PhnD/SsuA/transferrin family substrate-binding protein [Zoogloea oleivorans]MDY0035513.1 PhnD/SsuA/transferrin family substrate-binding protein [Zoogloea oleivorans]
MASQFKLSVCPHDTAKNLLGWFTLNTYLQRNLGTGIHFEPQDNFLVERQAVLDNAFHVVYANPYSALCFARDKGFVPVARPAGVVDETVVVRKAGAAALESPRIASATDKLVIHDLGLDVLRTLEIDPAKASFKFVGNHLNAAKAVLQDEADLGFVFNETWAGLAAATRAQLEVVGESTGGRAFHCFMVSPEWVDKREAIQHILCNMHLDPSGKRVLDDLHFECFEPVGEEVLAPLAALIGEPR